MLFYTWTVGLGKNYEPSRGGSQILGLGVPWKKYMKYVKILSGGGEGCRSNDPHFRVYLESRLSTKHDLCSTI